MTGEKNAASFVAQGHGDGGCLKELVASDELSRSEDVLGIDCMIFERKNCARRVRERWSYRLGSGLCRDLL